MTAPPFWLLPALGIGIMLWLPLYAARVRGRQYALFAGVVALSYPMAVLLALRLQELLGAAVGWLFVYGFVATALHAMHLVKARLRHNLYRYAVSLPGMAFQALAALSLPYFAVMLPLRALLHLLDAAPLLDVLRWLDLLPVVVVALGIVTSLGLRREVVRFELGDDGPSTFSRMAVERHRQPARAPAPSPRRPLRVVQISDPHLGPWQPVNRLKRRIGELLEHDPDLLLLTGDYMTMESNGTPGCLTEALEPLGRVAGRCFACLGNHDHEALPAVREAMAANGVRLLVDEAAVVTTPVGPVQILGADFHRRQRSEKLSALFARHPRIAGHTRVLLLHDPHHFSDLAPGEVDLVLSGHTHGGQVGLVSFGLDWTLLSRSRWPDHGLFGHGSSRLYVHRGTGFYGFPLRIGVPGEASLLELQLAGR